MTVDYPTRSATVVVANAALMAITGIFLLVRFYARVFLLHQVGLDDVFIWIASLFGFTLSISEILSMSINPCFLYPITSHCRFIPLTKQ